MTLDPERHVVQVGRTVNARGQHLTYHVAWCECGWRSKVIMSITRARRYWCQHMNDAHNFPTSTRVKQKWTTTDA